MIEVYQNGKLKLRLEGVGGGFSSDDIMVLPKTIADQCVMKAQAFDELFYNFLQESFPHQTNVTHEQAYGKAERIHEQYLGKRRYADFESFRRSRDRRINNEGK